MTRTPRPLSGERLPVAAPGAGRGGHPEGAAAREEGVTTAFAVIVFAALLGCAGLVYDGGMVLSARVRAEGLAEEAARAGAQELDLNSYRTTGALALRRDAAVRAAQSYLAAAGARTGGAEGDTRTGDAPLSGHASVAGDTVTVTVEGEQPTALLGLIGVRSLHLSAHATARAFSDNPTP